MCKTLIPKIIFFFFITILPANSFVSKDTTLILKSDDWKIFCKLFPAKQDLVNSTGIAGCSNAFKNTFDEYFFSNKDFKAWSATVNKKSGFIDGEHYGMAYGVKNNQTRANVKSYDLCVVENNFILTDFYSDNECALITIGNKIVHKKTILQFKTFSENNYETNEGVNLPKISLPPSIFNPN